MISADQPFKGSTVANPRTASGITFFQLKMPPRRHTLKDSLYI